jgi:2-deoxy-D-gluconate 3-dehydrogenase
MSKRDLSNLRLDGKVVFIAGIGSLGRVIAQGVSDAGAKVVVADSDLSAAEKVAKNIRNKNRPCQFCKMDILNPSEITQAIGFVQQNSGRVNVAINCVGINIRKPSLKVTEEDWDKVLDVNLKGAFFFAQSAAKAFLKQRKKGKIIAIASLLGFIGMEDRAAYAASKGGLINLVRSLAVEWAPYNINVNAIAPSFIPTPINRETVIGNFKKRLIDRTPLRRLGKPEDLVGAVIFLASNASNFITGQTIPIDGGWLSG